MQRWTSSPVLCRECLAEGARLLALDRVPKPVKTFRLPALEDVLIRQKVKDLMAWEKLQMFCPKPAECTHAGQTAYRGEHPEHWHAFSGIKCGAPAFYHDYFGGMGEVHYCEKHKPTKIIS